MDTMPTAQVDGCSGELLFQEVDPPGDLVPDLVGPGPDPDFEPLPELWAGQMRECATAHVVLRDISN